MYRLVKMFDKADVLQAGEKIVSFHFKIDGSILGVETDKSFYTLEKIVP